MISSCSTVSGALLWSGLGTPREARRSVRVPWMTVLSETHISIPVWSQSRLRLTRKLSVSVASWFTVARPRGSRIGWRCYPACQPGPWGMELSLGVYFLPFIKVYVLINRPWEQSSPKGPEGPFWRFSSKVPKLLLKMQFSLIIPFLFIRMGLRIALIKSRQIRKLEKQFWGILFSQAEKWFSEGKVFTTRNLSSSDMLTT